jgi:hypothetical protein
MESDVIVVAVRELGAEGRPVTAERLAAHLDADVDDLMTLLAELVDLGVLLTFSTQASWTDSEGPEPEAEVSYTVSSKHP